MKFELTNINKSINDLMRTIGYQPAYFSRILRDPANGGGKTQGEVSIVRQIGRNDYPRFHLYIKNSGKDFNFNLHLDQKKPSYEGSTGHSGDYDGDVVEGEAERIKSLLK